MKHVNITVFFKWCVKMSSNIIKKIEGVDILKIIMTLMIIGFITYLVVYWVGGQREVDNAKDALKRWTQDAVVLEKTTHWWGDSCLLDASNGERYYEDSCSRYVNGDKVIIMMYKNYYSWIEGLQNYPSVEDEKK